MTAPDDGIDLRNLPRFLKHLAHPERDRVASQFAQRLLDDGGEVVEFWGPQQMDVWRLTIRRGGHLVGFGVERGYPDGVTVRPAAGTQWTQAISLKLGIFAWARANDVELILDHPYDFRVDLLADGIATLDWLDAGNDEVVLRVHQAFRDGLVALGPALQPEDDAERHAIQIRLMEQAAERSRGD